MGYSVAGLLLLTSFIAQTENAKPVSIKAIDIDVFSTNKIRVGG